MGARHTKCCCCPECYINPGTCCTCAPKTICVTIGEYSGDCSTELDWDATGHYYAGSLFCAGTTYDLLFYFERDDDGCFFKLRSTALGYPEGYEYRWEIGVDIECQTLSGEVGDLSFEPVTKITPVGCDGCECLCECICVTVTREGGQVCAGKACWDSESEAYLGTVVCNDLYETEYDVEVKIGRRGDYDYENPDDDTCVIVLNVPSLGIEDEWQELSGCEGRNLDYLWNLDVYGEGQIVVAVRCAICNETCLGGLCCGRLLPNTLYGTLTNIRNCETDCLEGVVLTFVKTGETQPPLPSPFACEPINWYASHPACIHPDATLEDLQLCLGCVTDSDPNADVSAMHLRIGGSNPVSGMTPDSGTCDPLEITYVDVPIGYSCSFFNPLTVLADIIITE